MGRYPVGNPESLVSTIYINMHHPLTGWQFGRKNNHDEHMAPPLTCPLLAVLPYMPLARSRHQKPENHTGTKQSKKRGSTKAKTQNSFSSVLRSTAKPEKLTARSSAWVHFFRASPPEGSTKKKSRPTSSELHKLSLITEGPKSCNIVGSGGGSGRGDESTPKIPGGTWCPFF